MTRNARMDASEKEASRNEARITVVEDHFIVLNREVGEIVSQMKEIRWLVRLAFGGIAIATVKLLFFPA